MKTFDITYDAEGIIEMYQPPPEIQESAFDGVIRLSYPNNISLSCEHGIICALAGMERFCPGLDIIEDFKYAEDPTYWFFDTYLKSIIKNKENLRYIIHFEWLEDYGVFITTNNILEFMSGVRAVQSHWPIFINNDSQAWKTLKFIDTEHLTKDQKRFINKKEDYEAFTDFLLTFSEDQLIHIDLTIDKYI